MASIVSHPAHAGWVLFSNPHSLDRDPQGREIPGGRGKRQNLSLKLSRDDGRSWPVNKTLEKGSSAYSDLAVLTDGTIVCLYEGDKKIVLARFNLDWLTTP